MTKETMEFYRYLANLSGKFDKRYFDSLCRTHRKRNVRMPEYVKTLDSSPIVREENSLKGQQKKAMDFMIEKFSREERLLIMFQQDSKKFVDCFTADNFKDSGKRGMVIGELHETFRFLREKMAEFRWSKDFLLSRGIDFKQMRKFYFQLCV